MDSVKCFKCSRTNGPEDIICHGCGEKLLTGLDYEEKLVELKSYKEFRERCGIPGIIMEIILLLLIYPLVMWLVRIMPTAWGTQPQPTAIFQYTVLTIILLVFLTGILPRIIRRSRIRDQYHWSSETILELEHELSALPADFCTEAPARRIQGPPTILLVVLFSLLVLVYLNKYTEYKPLDTIASWLNIKNVPVLQNNQPAPVTGPIKQPAWSGQPIVAGRYDCHVAAADMGGGVMRSEQTWSYVFYANGTYTTYLEGSQQFSGSWSQSGNILTINVPAIPNISAAYSSHANVSSDGNSFISGDKKFVKTK